MSDAHVGDRPNLMDIGKPEGGCGCGGECGCGGHEDKHEGGHEHGHHTHEHMQSKLDREPAGDEKAGE